MEQVGKSQCIGGQRGPSIFDELKLVYDPVKRKNLPEQLRTAVVLAKLRSLAHVLILFSVVGLLTMAFGLLIGFPWIIDVALVGAIPIFLLMGVFLMNRIVHKEKEFKQLQWRVNAVSSGDLELRKLLVLPFPVELRKCSPTVLEEKMKQLEERSSSLNAEEAKDQEGHPDGPQSPTTAEERLMRTLFGVEQEPETPLPPAEKSISLPKEDMPGGKEAVEVLGAVARIEEMELRTMEEVEKLLAILKQTDARTKEEAAKLLAQALLSKEELVKGAIIELLRDRDKSRERGAQ